MLRKEIRTTTKSPAWGKHAKMQNSNPFSKCLSPARVNQTSKGSHNRPPPYPGLSSASQ